MRTTKFYNVYSILIIGLFLSYCLCYGFFIDFLLNLVTQQQELTLTFRLMITGKLDLPFTLIALVLNSFILLVIFIGHAKIMLLDMKSRVFSPVENQLDIQLIIDSICQQINLKNCPIVYLADVAFPNVFVFGLGRKRQNLVITTSLIQLLNEHELRVVLERQLLVIKLQLSTLITTVSLISNYLLILYDFFCFKSIYNPSNSSLNTKPKKTLRVVRFFIPIGSLWFKYFLDPKTIKKIDSLTMDELSPQSLSKAIIKIDQYHYANRILMATWYTQIRHNEVRREAFIFDPAPYNYAQTIGLPFTAHLSIQERSGIAEFNLD